ncbi:MAG: SHOCT domain-containing protein [Candidatus Liptonbacteria bacterium]|nr:SHOCT domain-containing protein [Candidatus Liptonbacteria bacterium]
MRKILFGIFSAILVLSLSVSGVRAQMMNMNNTAADDHTAKEEAEGQALWGKFQAKEIDCSDLTEENFAVLGEYFMGLMLGDSHEAMNQMMISMMGEDGEEAMHVVLGKRLSGCDKSAAFPIASSGFMPMMQIMGGGTNNMMNFGYGLGLFGWLFMVIWWALVIAGIVALIRWIALQTRGGTSGKSALDILKERYAKGEIDRKEFEEKLRDLNKA